MLSWPFVAAVQELYEGGVQAGNEHAFRGLHEMDVLRSTRVHGCVNACMDKCDFVPLCVKGWDFFTEAGSSARPVKMQTLIRIFFNWRNRFSNCI